jgi:hypothetical protein
VDSIRPVRGKKGRPSKTGDPHPPELRKRGIKDLVGKRRVPPNSGLGVARRVVERTLSWLHTSSAA